MEVCHIISEQRTNSRKYVQPGGKEQPLCWDIPSSHSQAVDFQEGYLSLPIAYFCIRFFYGLVIF